MMYSPTHLSVSPSFIHYCIHLPVGPLARARARAAPPHMPATRTSSDDKDATKRGSDPMSPRTTTTTTTTSTTSSNSQPPSRQQQAAQQPRYPIAPWSEVIRHMRVAAMSTIACSMLHGVAHAGWLYYANSDPAFALKYRGMSHMDRISLSEKYARSREFPGTRTKSDA